MGSFGGGAYRIFVLLLGIWTGSGIHDTLSTNFAWHADPVGYGRRPVPDGIVNPWPFTTMFLLLATLTAGSALWRHQGAGRREGLTAVGGTALILATTLGWFVPQLGLMEGGTLSDSELVAHARTWIALNAVRQVLLAGLFYYALVALPRLAAPTAGRH